MCGIFGFLSKGQVSPGIAGRAVRKLLILSESRGKEASGVAVASPGSINVLKSNMRARQLIRLPAMDALIRDAAGKGGPLAVIGHARMVTNGSSANHFDNQPVVKSGIVGIHNGIVVNVDEIYDRHPSLSRSFMVDSEVILDLLRMHLSAGLPLPAAVCEVFRELQGVASIACFFEDLNALLVATNNGSLYLGENQSRDCLVFGSEQFILDRFHGADSRLLDVTTIRQLSAGTAALMELDDLTTHVFGLDAKEGPSIQMKPAVRRIVDASPLASSETPVLDRPLRRMGEHALLEYDADAVARMRRCTKCLLPVQFPFIEFDRSGVCNYCHAYRKHDLFGRERLAAELGEGNARTHVVALSGGRDSCFALHYLKEEFDFKLLAYTYDWGMVTDLARRNISRMCAILGIEHILISANIQKKRDNIRKNVEAWLKRPHLGMVPLFMAGDKQFFYYADVVLRQNHADKLVFGFNLLERTDFKTGFCGIRPDSSGGTHYGLGLSNKLKLLAYYAKQLALNPAYLNSSLLDSAFAFASYYVIPHRNLFLFKYIPWNESEIIETLRGRYDWEVAPDTTSTWRIGDGTASFYNYIYYRFCGFTESDTFRSNQIREGILTRERALETVIEENRPRYEAIRWYCDAIGLDFPDTVTRINDLSGIGPEARHAALVSSQ